MAKKKKDNLGTRMKTYYEEIPKIKLARRIPVAMRIDGKAFHTLTRNMKKPFDDILVKSMQATMKYLCENIQGCVFGYTQSDEISIVLIDYQKLTSSAWFDYEVEKMCSIAASMATLEFNRAFAANIEDWKSTHWNITDPNDIQYWRTLLAAQKRGGMFDCRVFSIPKEEVTNLIYWRQVDATKNSVQMVGRAYFSHKELDKKSTNDIQDMLHDKFNVNWNDYPTHLKRGSACLKGEKGWTVDMEMPILTKDRDYIDRLVFVGES